MSFVAVIPARFASTRLPGKPLADIVGMPMVVRVAEAIKGAGASRVLVATDHLGVFDVVRQAGIEGMMTRADHPTGTDRLAEVAQKLALADNTILVNVQGDEPLIDPAVVSGVAQCLAANEDAACATAAHPIASAEEFFSPNVVKVVVDGRGLARYFSRAPIPWARDAFALRRDQLPGALPARRHIGIYAYRAGFLKRYATLAPAPTEQFEALEQLRILHHGESIAVLDWNGPLAPGVDTPEDLERVRAIFAAKMTGKNS